MGFLFAALATVIAAISAGLASFFGAPIALSLALVAVSYVACAIPVIKYGHRNFGGGGNTDVVGYVFVVLVVTAIAIPRLAPQIEDESSDPGSSPGDPELSSLDEGIPISGRIVENSTMCTVDAACSLRIQFADTTVTALYGAGERPSSPCDVSVEVSDTAFQVEAGDHVEVVLEACSSNGLYLRQITREPAPPSD